jgi:hypothetical protein
MWSAFGRKLCPLRWERLYLGSPDDALMDQLFYLRLLLAALIILAVWNLMGKDDLLEPVGDWLEKHAPYWGKPIGLCPPCMSSVYGTATWFLTGGDWMWWIPFVLALSGTMVLVSRNLLK